VLLKPFFQIVGLAAVVSSSALTLDYVNPISHEQKRPGFPWPVLSGSPGKTRTCNLVVNSHFQRESIRPIILGSCRKIKMLRPLGHLLRLTLIYLVLLKTGGQITSYLLRHDLHRLRHSRKKQGKKQGH
jgi:hypothetical protein